MTNNDILRMFRYAMEIGDEKLTAVFALGGRDLDVKTVRGLLGKEGEEGYVALDDLTMEAFLDGFIVHERGARKEGGTPAPKEDLTNNIILKKLRIGLNFKENDMMEIFRLAGMDVSKSMLSALFRKKGHKNYKECGDQFLRNFLKGLAVRYRG
ncbi:MAG: DUF1456 family protein [Desulfobacteraceae bacterium]|nr:DUF1456 family protein [Desulfobacteraceae bacterium]